MDGIPKDTCVCQYQQSACSISLLFKFPLPVLAATRVEEMSGEEVKILDAVQSRINPPSICWFIVDAEYVPSLRNPSDFADDPVQRIVVGIRAKTLAEKYGAGEAALDRSNDADVVVPVFLDQVDIDRPREVRFERAVDFHPWWVVKLLCVDSLDARSKLQAECLSEPKHILRDSVRVGVVLLDRQLRADVQDLVEDIGRIPVVTEDLGSIARSLVGHMPVIRDAALSRRKILGHECRVERVDASSDSHAIGHGHAFVAEEFSDRERVVRRHEVLDDVSGS